MPRIGKWQSLLLTLMNFDGLSNLYIRRYLNRSVTIYSPAKTLAGEDGFKPPTVGIKIRCLIAWLFPYVVEPNRIELLSMVYKTIALTIVLRFNIYLFYHTIFYHIKTILSIYGNGDRPDPRNLPPNKKGGVKMKNRSHPTSRVYHIFYFLSSHTVSDVSIFAAALILSQFDKIFFA